jgi:bis(5'-nucleosyl)-tetraphosphatase (symmetrical)
MNYARKGIKDNLMPTYAIGDVQGCYDELQELLQLIQFDPIQDHVWFVGDLINRGPKSLEVLRFVKETKNAITVLGNHDLHLLALAQGNPYSHHTLQEVLSAPDCTELVDWLRRQPLLHSDSHLNYIMVHAGLPPQWDLAMAQACAREVEDVLRDDKLHPQLLQHMYGDEPRYWDDSLTGWERWRFIINAFTRLRFCDAQGGIEPHYKGKLGAQPSNLIPWFKFPHRKSQNLNIIFGHWAALQGETGEPHVYALDTGCVWGHYLTAMRLEDRKRFRVHSKKSVEDC